MGWSEWDQNGGLEFITDLHDLGAQIIRTGEELVCVHRQIAGNDLVGRSAEGAAAFEAEIAWITDRVKSTNVLAAVHHDRETGRDYPFFGGW